MQDDCLPTTSLSIPLAPLRIKLGYALLCQYLGTSSKVGMYTACPFNNYLHTCDDTVLTTELGTFIDMEVTAITDKIIPKKHCLGREPNQAH